MTRQVTNAPATQPIRMSRPISGSRTPPPSSRLHETIVDGQWRRTYGSKAT